MRFTYLLFYILLISSCTQHENLNIPSFPLKNSDSIRVDNLISQKRKQLNIESLETGFDSIQIRIWYEYSLLKKRDLIILKFTQGEWNGTFYSMIVDWDPLKTTETILSKSVKNVKPKSGWNNFTKKLVDLKLTTLPNMRDIPGLSDTWDDGTTYAVEIAAGKKYRTYSYHEPEEFKDYWQANKMLAILEIFSKELNVPE